MSIEAIERDPDLIVAPQRAKYQRTDLPRFLGEIARLVDPVAARCVGEKRFLAMRTNVGDVYDRGICLTSNGVVLLALTPGGLRAAECALLDDGGGWTTGRFERPENVPLVSSLRGVVALHHLHAAMVGIPMRREAWRRQRILTLLREWNSNTSPTIDMIGGMRL